MRQVTFSMVVDSDDRRRHVVVNLDPWDTVADAIQCLRDSRPDDWKHFYCLDDKTASALYEAQHPKPTQANIDAYAALKRYDEWYERDLRVERARDAQLLASGLIPPCIAKPDDKPTHHASYYEAETFGGYDFSDVGDLFDHLDPETRHLVREAIAMDDYAMEETLHG